MFYRQYAQRFLFIAFLASPFLVFAQATSIEVLEAQLAQERAAYALKIERLEKLEARAIEIENARLREQNKASELKTFIVSLDCSKYTGAAREMCLQALKEPNEHERSHFINSMCRQAYAEGRKGNCIHVGWTKDSAGKTVPVMTWIDEPAGTIPGLISTNCTPSFFKSCDRYSTYLLQPKTPAPSKWDNVSYLFDEWGAYNISGRERLNKVLNGGKKDLMVNIVEGPMDFVVIAASIAQYQKNLPNGVFNEKQFRDFMRKQIENSMGVVRDAYAAQEAGKLFKGETGGHTRAVYEQFLRSGQAQLLRQMYGDAWFDRTFNIDF